ncbi:MAG: MFS transporter [Pyrinomonadaceae bacterium]
MNEPPKEDSNNSRFLTKPLIIIYITVFFDLVGFGILIPLLPFYAESFGASPFATEMIFAVYSAMQFIFSPLLGSLSDKYGRRPILFFSLLGSVIGYLVLGFAGSLWMVFLGRIIAGITGGNISAAQAYIADSTSKENRAKGMGLFGAMFGLGFVFGPAIGGILSRFGNNVPFLFAAVLALGNAIALYFFLPESRKKSSVPQRGNRLKLLFSTFINPKFTPLLLLYFLVVMSFSMLTASFALYTMFQFGYDAEQNGFLFFYVGVLALIFQGVLFSRAVATFGERQVVVFGSFLLSISLFAVPLINPQHGGLPGLLIGMAVFTLGNALSTPALSSLSSKIADDDEQGRVLGTMQSAASLARAVGPLLGGVLLNNSLNKIDDFTLRRTFWTASAIMFLAVLIALSIAKKNRKTELHA